MTEPRSGKGLDTSWKVLWGGCLVQWQEAGREKGAEGLGAAGGRADWRMPGGGSSEKSWLLSHPPPPSEGPVPSKTKSSSPCPPPPKPASRMFAAWERAFQGTITPQLLPALPSSIRPLSPSADPESTTSLSLWGTLSPIFSCHLWASRVC